MREQQSDPKRRDRKVLFATVMYAVSDSEPIIAFALESHHPPDRVMWLVRIQCEYHVT